MTGSQIALGLVLVAAAGLGGYFSARRPRKPPFDQFRESPMFQPRGRAASAAIGIIFAAFMAFLFFAGRL
ncbi:MAG TPA: hypothetical protein VEC11_12950 [Allosphingosinicella sp.]|nr:hypothetical protein [Allosphingosinicella sp.]